MPQTGILKKPHVTERATMLSQFNQYVVNVDPKATKGQIREEVERKFKVDVLEIRTVKIRGKFRRRFGPKGGYQSDGKKAIVTIKAGQKITWEEAKA